jgi:glyoxylase-like metal-dependent hydrolase (beta-lactamase superfamily II)
MILTEPGWVTDHVLLLGRRETCVQLVDGGAEAALLGGSMSYVVPDVLEQLERFGVDERKIRYLVVLHAHFDHCGATPAFKRRWPWATVCGSARARDLLADARIVPSIAALDRAAAARAGRTAAVEANGWAFDGVAVERVLTDGETFSVGGVALETLAVPGHSSCSIALFDRAARVLFPSDAAGISAGEFFFTAGNSNVDQYLVSLERLAALDVEAVVREHYGAQTGPDARATLARAVEDGRRTRDLLETTWRRLGDQGRCAAAVLDALAAGAPTEFLPREVLGLVVAQMVKHVARKLGPGGAERA